MNVQIKHSINFVAGIYYDNSLSMNHYTVTLRLLTNCVDPEHQNIAFERIKYFIYNELENTIFINQNNRDKAKALMDCGLSVTTMPEEPVDQLIGIMLYYKLNAITEDQIIVIETELSSLIGENIIYIHNENEGVNFANRPDWWSAPDLVHCDHDLLNNDKILTIHQNNTWKNANLNWNDNPSDSTSASTVVFADFKKE
jgi:hypothetical protein